MKAVLLLTLLSVTCVYSQLYTEKKTRHRFAQLNFGLDYRTSLGGSSSFVDAQGQLQNFDLKNSSGTRFIIGGTHFWGHADFYIAIPFTSSQYSTQNQKLFHSSSVETVLKFYPWPINDKHIRPFLGFAFTPFYYEQDNTLIDFGDGPDLNHTSFPLTTGFTFNRKNHLLEVGLSWNYQNNQEYYISRDLETTISTPRLQLSFSYRYMLDTTLGAEAGWESGRTQSQTGELAQKGGLNSFYIGLGISSSFWLSQSSYNESNRPYLTKYSTSLLPDFALGYYFHKLDMNLGLSYRGINSNTDAYGAVQSVKRKSLGLEITKNLFDYNGFVPFIGPIISRENLRFEEFFERQRTFSAENSKMALGLTFGWDIRPNRLQSWLLRTNLRWYPSLELEVGANENISFNNLEFNFIQLIIYPERIF